VHAVEPAAEYVPNGQLVQVAEPYMPAVQGEEGAGAGTGPEAEQLGDPGADVVPAGQAMHVLEDAAPVEAE